MEVVTDPKRGHVALVREGEAVVTFSDLGIVLHVWQTGDCVELYPGSARRLGEALIAWADHKQHGGQWLA